MTYDEELHDALTRAEERFGARICNNAVRSVIFHDGLPQVFFITATRTEIRLPLRCEFDYLLACYHLAHEAVHLLSPVGYDEITTLEEGIAVMFARDYLREAFDFAFPVPSDRRYAGAFALAEKFLTPRPNAILRLRNQEPVISRITTDLMQQTYPEVPDSLCFPLATPFCALSTA